MILLDTHVVIWLSEAPELLSRRAEAAITAAREEAGVAIADKTLWEIAHLVSRKQIELQVSLAYFLTTLERLFTVLPITAGVAERAVQFSANYPRDPTDRLIGATALANAIELVTADKAIRASGEVPCIW